MIKLNILLILLTIILSINSFAQYKVDTTLESVLDLSIDELLNTKVSIATKSEKSLNEAPAIVTVISAELIKNTGARNLQDILQYIPGFEFSKPRAGFFTIGVRGVKDPLTNSRFLVLKDGAPYNGIMYGSGIGIMKQFDINTIERIEVVRGPGSALYGRNAFIGVVNIITRSGKGNNEIDLRASAGNFNTLSYGAAYGTKKDDFDAYFSIEKMNSDVTDSKFDNGMGGEAVWNLGVDNVFANTKIRFKDFVITGMYSDIHNDASIGPFITESDKDVKIGVYSLDYSKDINTKTKLNTKLYGRNEIQIQNIEIFKPGITAEAAPGLPFSAIYPNGMYATPDFNAYTYGADLNLNMNLHLQHNTLIGIQTDFYGIKNADLKSSYDAYTGMPLTYVENGQTIFRGKDTQIKEERGWIEGGGHDYTNIAFYLQHIYNPIKRLSITLGGRYDIDSEFGGIFNPRFALVWNSNHKLNYKLLYGQAYRAPNVQEQYRLTGFTLGNRDLKPETIKTTELSIDYSINKNINTRLTIFYNALDNMIFSSSNTTGIPDTTYSNISENKSLGFEYEFKMSFNKQFYMYLNYSFTSSENKVTFNNEVEYYKHRDIAPHKMNIGLNYRFLKYFNANTNLMYRSEREKYSSINEGGEIVAVSQDEIGNYFILNGKLRLINFFNTMEVSLEAYNILNTKYYDQDTENAHQPLREGSQYIFSLSYTF